MIRLKKKRMTIKEAYDEYVDFCRVRNFAKDTLTFYENTIHRYSKFQDLDEDVWVIDKKNVWEYINYLQSTGVKETTLHTYVRGLKTILRYFMSEGYIETFHIELPKQTETFKEVYTDDEIKKILKKPNVQKCTFADYRNWVLANFFLGTGCRLNTTINIKIKDVDLHNGTIKLKTTKGRREVILPLSSAVKKVLREYLKYREGTEEDFLFCNRDGTQMTRSSITSAIKIHNKKCGVHRTSIHLFRHTFAKLYLMNGGDVFRLQKLMDHKDINITQHYLNLTTRDLAEGFDNYNPLDNATKEVIKIKK